MPLCGEALVTEIEKLYEEGDVAGAQTLLTEALVHRHITRDAGDRLLALLKGEEASAAVIPETPAWAIAGTEEGWGM